MFPLVCLTLSFFLCLLPGLVVVVVVREVHHVDEVTVVQGLEDSMQHAARQATVKSL